MAIGGEMVGDFSNPIAIPIQFANNLLITGSQKRPYPLSFWPGDFPFLDVL
jgi:hypothetical protein